MEGELMKSLDLSILLPICGVEISNARWTEIIKASGLPDEARPFVERAIMLHKLFNQAIAPSATPAAARQFLTDLAKRADALCDELDRTAANPLALVVLGLAIGEGQGKSLRPDIAKVRLKDAAADVAKLSTWVKAGRSRVIGGRPGPRRRADATTIFVQVLDQILQDHTGKRIDRSNKGHRTSRDFVQAVFRLADPKIGKATIEEAMKRVIKARGRVAGKRKR
jgi:hypothetical protein